MQNPEAILANLSKRAVKEDYKFERIYRILYNPQMYHRAYSNIYANKGSATKGIDGTSADGFGADTIALLVKSMKDETYRPSPAKRVYIPKKDGRKRPLGIPSFYDRIIQDICRMILEAIYEPVFSEHSHGFRPNKSCHTALKDVKVNFKGINWFVEGDIKGFFDNIDHHVIIRLLRGRIQDEKFIRLVWKFLRAGYIEDFRFNKTYSGTPQGGIISPILANIYLNQLDGFVENTIKTQFDRGDTVLDRNKNPKYKYWVQKAYKTRKKIGELSDCEERTHLILKHKEFQKEIHKTRPYLPDTNSYKRIKFVRYADDFIIGVNGSKKDCQEIKKAIATFLKEELSLELSEGKTLITYGQERAKFLGYEITVDNCQTVFKSKKGYSVRCANKNIRLYMPSEVIRDFIVKEGMVSDINSEHWMPIHRSKLIRSSDLEIVSTYNAELRGLYNYYRMATNVSRKMWQLHYVMEYSCLKTLANKHRSSLAKMRNKFRIGKHWGIRYQTKQGVSIRYFYNEGYVIKDVIAYGNIDNKPNIMKYRGRTELEARIAAKTCELCGKQNVDFEIHHVNRLKNLKGKDRWEIVMLSRKRKTLVVCKDCHKNVCHPHG